LVECWLVMDRQWADRDPLA